MILGKVTGTVVSTAKIAPLEGFKLLLVRPVDPQGAFAGGSVVALDTVQAGVGDTVFIIDEGGSANQILRKTGAPIRTVIAGIVDRVDLRKEGKNVQ